MLSQIIILSGAIGVGKSTLAAGLAESLSCAKILSSRLVLTELLASTADREAQRQIGDQLDASTRGRWLADEAAIMVDKSPRPSTLVIDAVRTVDQVAALRSSFAVPVHHIHLNAGLGVLKKRFEARRSLRAGESASFEDTRNNATEVGAEALVSIADVVFDTSSMSESDVLNATLGYLVRMEDART